MRTIEHGTQRNTQVDVIDEPSLDNGANHVYKIRVVDNPEAEILGAVKYVDINFQDGPVKEAGINGIHNEDLLVIVLDRLEGFQRGKFACQENVAALIHVLGAMNALNARTNERRIRGVEGVNVI